ncbi:MAG TPA: hypothetical protein H9671_03085 [Firmicutes bacterium]|nr:hypothetical protein [Bacillota bacterium]
MYMKEKTFQKLNYIWIAIFLILGLSVGIYNIFCSTPYYIMLAFASIAFLAIPPLAYKVFKLQAVPSLTFMVYTFSFLAFTIGMVFNGYKLLLFYDKFVHTLSGVFFGLIGIGCYYLLKPVKKIESMDYKMVTYFCISFALSIAVIWEIYEYAIHFILGTDPQHVLDTGVNDTMQDMIVCLIGALLLCIPIYLFYRKKKTDFFMGVFQSFFDANYKKNS